jgi:hypothetical protein
MASCSPSELVASGKCFLPLLPVQREAIIISLLCKILQENDPMATCDPSSLLEDAKCFTCLPPNQQQAIQTQLLCEILHSGGTGSTCIVCLDEGEEPSDPATCDCSIAYNNSGQFWFWNSLTSSWFPISL